MNRTRRIWAPLALAFLPNTLSGQGLPLFEIIPAGVFTSASGDPIYGFQAWKIDRKANRVSYCYIVYYKDNSVAGKCRPGTKMEDVAAASQSRFSSGMYTREDVPGYKPSSHLWSINTDTGEVQICMESFGCKKLAQS